MKMIIDPDVQSLIEFMQRRIATAKLMGVAEALPPRWSP